MSLQLYLVVELWRERPLCRIWVYAWSAMSQDPY